MTDDRRAALWWGDAVRALTALQPDDATARTILAMLGLHEPVPGAPPVAVAPPAAAPATREPGPPPLPTSRAVAAGATPPRPPSAPQTFAVAPVVEADEPAARSGAPPRPLPLLADVLPPPPPPATEPAGLLPPGQQRTILATLASRRAPVGDVDVDALVEVIAQRQPLRTLPRKPAVTTRRGLQVLLDFGEGMRGFQRDRDEVWAAITVVAGSDGLDVLRFASTPLEEPGAGPGPKPTWRRYEPPAWGRPVLVVSDLGTAHPGHRRAAVVAAWVETAHRLRQAGCPVTALVPAPAERVAPELHAAMGVVTWDRTTGVRDAVAAMRRAGRRLPEEDPW
jgi:hypothetical protein